MQVLDHQKAMLERVLTEFQAHLCLFLSQRTSTTDAEAKRHYYALWDMMPRREVPLNELTDDQLHRFLIEAALAAEKLLKNSPHAPR